MTILDKILAEKEKEVEKLKKDGFEQGSTFPKRSLYDSFTKSDRLNVIAEIKRASPSKGDIHITVDPVEQAKIYENAGAGAISILTDTPFFKGTMEDLRRVREVVDVPILCKDFIIDPIQIDRAKANGADVILLIAAALPTDRLDALYHYATSKNLEVLLEVHDQEELDIAKKIGANIIGINNRNLKTFEVDLGITEKLAKTVSLENTLLISESGFKNEQDAARVIAAGAKGILVGETLMKSTSIAQAISAFRLPLGVNNP
ncbi:indole-3-glycerol phosphate synthase [Salirhabdus euzebyi]|uniref:Indole-3-glycerol phosphate synthase n=1 Tax=Salirhabdus euzebyi TaxID=394506 RepID=A0A841Q9E9_9BACI|nr:indole-3-glycerol phosphate synthase TrpC [Salirhabdus euzebyi]MBB6455121.1 indole-3-glycerol phosphate synthase [Salirhabdus euzebyi]